MSDFAPYLLPFFGLLAGIILGYTARRRFFCTMSSLEQYWNSGNSTGIRTWMLATVTAAIATQSFVLTGNFDPTSSFYLTSHFNWLSAIIGGLAFGFGMALVGTCGFGALVRLGGGSLKSLIAAIILAIAAISTQRGLLALGRVNYFDPFTLDLTFAGNQSIPDVISALINLNIQLPVTLVLIGLPLIWVFYSAEFRKDYKAIVTGLIIGAVVALGWVITTWISTLSFDPVQIESTSYVVPMGDTLLQFAIFLGNGPDYGVGIIIGTVMGANFAARSCDDIRWEACDDARELSRHIIGALLMGTGGVLALGCTIGQGVSAASLLALSVPVTVTSIIIGAKLGLTWLLEGSIANTFKR